MSTTRSTTHGSQQDTSRDEVALSILKSIDSNSYMIWKNRIEMREDTTTIEKKNQATVMIMTALVNEDA